MNITIPELRLRGNMIVPGTFIFPDEPQVKSAGERGPIVTQHHIKEARAGAIRMAIGKQLELVRAERKNPYFLMNAWMEAVPMIRKGVLKLPEGVTLVWPD